MVSELIIEKSKLSWLFTFDLIKLSADSIRDVSKRIASSSLVQGWSYYYTPDERHQGVGKIEESDPESGSQKL